MSDTVLRLIAAAIIVGVIYLHSPTQPAGNASAVTAEIAERAKTELAGAALRSGFVGDMAREGAREWVAPEKPREIPITAAKR